MDIAVNANVLVTALATVTKAQQDVVATEAKIAALQGTLADQKAAFQNAVNNVKAVAAALNQDITALMKDYEPVLS